MNYVLLPQSDPFYASLLNLPNLTHIITPHLNHPTHLSHLKKLFLPYEASYPAARTCLPIALNRLILNLKDKYVFRKKLSAIFPHFFFVKIDLDDLDHFKFEYFKKDRYLVKPKLGFMSAGARVFDHHTDLSALKNDIKDELVKFSKFYPDVFSYEMLIEQYVDGPEYAVDMFYDCHGKPVITNIYAHPEPKHKKYLQMLYYTSEDVFINFYESIYNFFLKFNEDLEIKSFPIHAEFKLENNTLIPIEFNPARFGGMGLCCLTTHAFQFNPVQYYLLDQAPDWKQIWQRNKNNYFYWLLAYNGADIDLQTYRPNHNKFKKFISASIDILAYQELDYLNNPGFAIAYLQTQQKSKLNDLLSIEFNDFFILDEQSNVDYVDVAVA